MYYITSENLKQGITDTEKRLAHDRECIRIYDALKTLEGRTATKALEPKINALFPEYSNCYISKRTGNYITLYLNNGCDYRYAIDLTIATDDRKIRAEYLDDRKQYYVEYVSKLELALKDAEAKAAEFNQLAQKLYDLQGLGLRDLLTNAGRDFYSCFPWGNLRPGDVGYTEPTAEVAQAPAELEAVAEEVTAQADSEPTAEQETFEMVPEEDQTTEAAEEAAEAPATTSTNADQIAGKGWRVLFDTENQRTRVVFDSKPARNVIEAVKEAGFFWSPKMQSWNKHLTNKARRAAAALAEKLATLAA